MGAGGGRTDAAEKNPQAAALGRSPRFIRVAAVYVGLAVALACLLVANL